MRNYVCFTEAEVILCQWGANIFFKYLRLKIVTLLNDMTHYQTVLAKLMWQMVLIMAGGHTHRGFCIHLVSLIFDWLEESRNFLGRQAHWFDVPGQHSSFLRPVKDNLGLRKLGVYRILRQCGKVYIGQTHPSVDPRLKGHQWHIRL
jgi:hypothetical protein